MFENPSSESCVDKINSATYNYMRAIDKSVISKDDLRNKMNACACQLRQKEPQYHFLFYLNKSVENLIYFTSCEKVSHSELSCKDIIPKFIP